MSFWCNALNVLNFIILLFIYLFTNSLFFKKAFSKLKKNYMKNIQHISF
jgi:hypothetical protein